MTLEKYCLRCSKLFKKPYTCSLEDWKFYKHCSRECRKNPLKKCAICGVWFSARGKYRKINAKYCSFECARKGQINYKGGVSREADPSLFSYGQRQRIRKRDKYMCQDCGVCKKDLVIHHMTFTKEVLSDNLLVLVCRNCHSKRHYEHDKIKVFN